MTSPRLALLLAALLVVVFQGDYVHAGLFNFCDSPHGKVVNVSCSVCKDTDTVCIVKEGTNLTLEIDFIPSYEAKTVTVDATAMGYNLPIDDKEACDYALQCPVKVGEVNKFKANFSIPDYAPVGIKATVTAQLVDDSDTDLVCITFEAKVEQ